MFTHCKHQVPNDVADEWENDDFPEISGLVHVSSTEVGGNDTAHKDGAHYTSVKEFRVADIEWIFVIIQPRDCDWEVFKEGQAFQSYPNCCCPFSIPKPFIFYFV